MLRWEPADDSLKHAQVYTLLVPGNEVKQGRLNLTAPYELPWD